jgi:hypothetical protein
MLFPIKLGGGIGMFFVYPWFINGGGGMLNPFILGGGGNLLIIIGGYIIIYYFISSLFSSLLFYIPSFTSPVKSVLTPVSFLNTKSKVSAH